MSSSTSRLGVRVGAGSAAILAALALTAAPTPALAADGQPHLELSTSSDAVVDNTGTTLGYYLYNTGDTAATGVTITVDGSALRDDVVVSAPDWTEGCKLAGRKVTCEYVDMEPGHSDTFYPVRLASKPGSAPGEAGNLVVTLKGTGPDGTETSGSTEQAVTIVASGPDLVAAAEDIGSEQERVGPGDTRPIRAILFNEGDTAAEGFFVSFSLPTGAEYAERYSDCVYSGGWDVDPPAGYAYGPGNVTCKADVVLQPGEGLALFDPDSGEAVFNAFFGKNLPGPEETNGVFEVGLLDNQELPAAHARVKSSGSGPSFAAKVNELRAKNKDKRSVAQNEADTDDNYANFNLWTKANSLDFDVKATPVAGTVGATVEVPYTVTNHGPSDGSVSWKIVAPTGTVLLPGNEYCYFTDGNGHPVNELTEVTCNTEGLWPSKFSGSGVRQFTQRVKIKSTPGTNGTITVRTSYTETNKANNTAKIVLNGSDTSGGGGGELPITGVQAGLIGGVGAGILALGAVLFVVARRRRVVLVPPSE